MNYCHRPLLLTLLLLVCGVSAQTQGQTPQDPFVIVVYNVENLFDADGIALYDDYKQEKYHPADLLKKLQNITKVLAKFRQGKGPNIILFQEFEADQTPSSVAVDYKAMIDRYKSTSLDKMLKEDITPEIRDLPVQVLLLKSLLDAGLDAYQVAVGDYRPDPTGRSVAHVNATFSQFPIEQAHTHQTDGARGIVEVVHNVGGFKLTTLNNHWKSGASNGDDERIRLGNARVLKERLDQILQQDPSADIVIGGDFNSQYNQKKVNPKMEQTAINDVIGSQGDELAIRKPGGPALYNLWHDVPIGARGSDVYQENWGTLMQMMVTKGLYDFNGIQYVDNSFKTAALENVNCQVGTKVPISWQSIHGMSGGFSDHLPVYAQFRVVHENDKNQFLPLSHAGTNDDPSELRKVDYSVAVQGTSIVSVKSLMADKQLKSIDNIGQVYSVDATVSGEKPFRIKIFNDEYTVWAFNEKIRVGMYKRFPVGSSMKFLGELGIHKEQWQFIVRDSSWLDVAGRN